MTGPHTLHKTVPFISALVIIDIYITDTMVVEGGGGRIIKEGAEEKRKVEGKKEKIAPQTW